MSILSKKIASRYMQKQAGSGALLAFPSVMFNLKELSNQAKDQVSDALIDGLVDLFKSNFLFTNDSPDYDVKTLKKDYMEGEVTLLHTGRYYRDTGWEYEEGYGETGAKLLVKMDIRVKEVSEFLANFLNTKVHQFFTAKIKPQDLIPDLKSGSLKNAISMFIKSKINKADFYDDSVVQEFAYGWDLVSKSEFISKNNFDGGEQSLNYATFQIKEIIWEQGNLSFIIDLEIDFAVEGGIADTYDGD